MSVTHKARRAIYDQPPTPILHHSRAAHPGSRPFWWVILPWVRNDVDLKRLASVCKLFRETKVGKDRVTAGIEEDVFGFEIPDNDTVAVAAAFISMRHTRARAGQS